MDNIRQKTVTGILWSFIDNFSNLGISFIVGLILARLLSPKEFGLIGMVTVFIAISNSFVNSGFSQALIKKKDCTETDYSTVFFFNLTVGLFFYLMLFLLAPTIGLFFKEPQLIQIVRILGFTLIIDSLTIIQRTTLTKRVDFKLQTKITVSATIISGSISIWLAYNGFGVWSLVVKTLIQEGVNSFLLWLFNRWRPMLVFSKKSFSELFSFGSKLLISGLIDTIYRNVYYIIIGKYFSAQALGFYTRADQFKELPSSNINGIVSRVSYPVLAHLQDEPERLKSGYKNIIKVTMLITFVLMIGMAAAAEPMIITLIGEKWRTSIVYLQMLCFVGMLYPLHSLNLNMLNVQGRSDLFLRLEIIKKTLAIPTIIIGIFWGIKIMILGMMINSIISYYINSYWSGKFINYSIKEQIKDILPSFLVALSTGLVVYTIGVILPLSYPLILTIQVVIGGILAIGICELFKLDAYFEIKNIVLSKIISKKWQIKSL
jgi:O-antigen/teichoic acid export membrane protein